MGVEVIESLIIDVQYTTNDVQNVCPLMVWLSIPARTLASRAGGLSAVATLAADGGISNKASSQQRVVLSRIPNVWSVWTRGEMGCLYVSHSKIPDHTHNSGSEEWDTSLRSHGIVTFGCFQSTWHAQNSAGSGNPEHLVIPSPSYWAPPFYGPW